MHTIQNNLYQISKLTLICLFFTACNYTCGREVNINRDNINRDYKPADLNEIASYETEEFISAFFHSSSAAPSNENIHQRLKFRTKTVTGYSVEYSTSHPYNTGNITASGLLLIPSSSKPLPLLVYHRGTLETKEAAPSLIPDTMSAMDPKLHDERITMIMLAMQGYIILAPDYTGYGSSNNIRHPYLHKKSVTQTSLDMFFSVTEAIKERGVLLNRDVHIMGYSQGGHGALAFAQGFQESNQIDFRMRSISAGSGPYDLSETAKQLMSQDYINRINTLLFLQAYSYIYNWDLSTIVREKSHQEAINSAFEYETIIESAEKIPDKVKELFTPRIIEDIKRKRNTSMQKNFEENSVYRWVPDAPVFLFHTKDDIMVPYINMEIAYDFFSKNGSTPVTRRDCSLERFDGFVKTSKMLNHDGDIENIKLNHDNCIFIFVWEASDYIDTL